jgi:hypothetical protein
LNKSFAVSRSTVGKLFVSREVNLVAAHQEPGTMWFVLLWSVVATKLSVSLCACLGDVRFLDEEALVSAFYVMTSLELFCGWQLQQSSP